MFPGLTSDAPEIKDRSGTLSFGGMKDVLGSHEPSTKQPLPLSSLRVTMHKVQPIAFKFISRLVTIHYLRTSILVSMGLKLEDFLLQFGCLLHATINHT